MTAPSLAVFSPLPPQPSGIADYNTELLLPALAERADVIAVVPDELVSVVEAPVPVVGSGADRAAPGTRRPIYHVGNDAALHGWIHDALLHQPGLVVLHDPSMLDFYAASLTPEAFAAEVRHNYDDVRVARPEREGIDRGDPDPLAVRLERRVVDASLGVIVHSEWAHDEITARCPTASVFHVPLAAPSGPLDRFGPDPRQHFGWSEDDVVFGVPAAFARRRRAAYTARLFAVVLRSVPHARLLLTGRVDDPAALDDARTVLAEEDVAYAAGTLTDVPEPEFRAALAISDVVVDLRWPSAGEFPASVALACSAGKPVIVSDLPQLRHLDDRFCWRVPADPLGGAAPTVQAMIRAAGDRAGTRTAGEAARAHAEAEWTPARVAGRYLEVLAAVERDPPRRAVAVTPPIRTEALHGVNAIGDFDATTGLMEAGRRIVSGIVTAGVDVAVTRLASHADRNATRTTPTLAHLPAGRPHAIDLWLLNINELGLVTDVDLRPPDQPRYAIGCWFWELTGMPPGLSTQLQRVDEVWVASQFVRESMRAAAPAGLPVHVMGCLVEAPAPPTIWRSPPLADPDSTTFFFNFDVNSTPARKNPWAVIEAFREAFPPGDRGRAASLIVKVQHLERVPAFEAALRDAIADVRGVLIDAELTRAQMNALLGSIDVYVSLHRSEGFGLGIAEAMYLGKPAIVTAYSGNMDFTDAANSCLVGYRLRTIESGDHAALPGAAILYLPGLEWADPSVEDAARWMRLLHDRPSLRGRIGQAAAATIRQRYSPRMVQARLARRLSQIQVGLDALPRTPLRSAR